MRTRTKFIVTNGLLALACVMANAFASPPTVNPEQMDVDPDILAKIGKEKSRQSSLADSMKTGTTPKGSNGDCGSVNINSNNEKKSSSGIKEMFGKQSTTIVTGPVINMATCK